jgi:hypothetical protein
VSSTSRRLLLGLAFVTSSVLGVAAGYELRVRDGDELRPSLAEGGLASAYAALLRRLPGGADPRGDLPLPGLWNPAPERTPSDALRAQLDALGYLDAYDAAPEADGVTRFEAARTQPGLNLYTSGHRAEAVLMDLAGRPLHRWAYDYFDAFPETPPDFRVQGQTHWRHARLLEDGELLAIYGSAGLVKLDADSRLVFVSPLRFHHDLDVDAEGRIWGVAMEIHVVPRIHPEEAIYEDFLVTLAPDGQLLRRLSLVEAFERSSYASLLARMKPSGDVFHTNTVEVLDGAHAARHPAFRRGNVLISVRELDVIAVVDPERGEVVWALTGQWRAQHKPTFLADGRLLLFDNLGHPEASSVLEVDPLSQHIAWRYGGDPALRFFSETCGASQRLANGNTLITESNRGRAFEVTPEGEVVWEFYNPARAGERNELVATLFEVERIPSNDVASWLDPAVVSGRTRGSVD